jgi:hypothetical protein
LPHWRGRWFYILTFLFAFLPLPFSVVRLQVLRHRPQAALYGLTVMLGRLPRYLLTVFFWRSLALPAWSNVALILAAASFAVYKTCQKPDREGGRVEAKPPSLTVGLLTRRISALLWKS